MKRIWKPWHEWECYKAGFYKSTSERMSPNDARLAYAAFLGDSSRFIAALDRVLQEWPNSCAHFLSNESINRIAWLGQASMCIDTGVPACHRGGFKLLSREAQRLANTIALDALNRWIRNHAENQSESVGVHRDMEAQGLFG